MLLFLLRISTHWETFVLIDFKQTFAVAEFFYYFHSKLKITSLFVLFFFFEIVMKGWHIFRKMLFPSIIAKTVDFVLRETKLNCKTHILCWWVSFQLRISFGRLNLKSNFCIISYNFGSSGFDLETINLGPLRMERLSQKISELNWKTTKWILRPVGQPWIHEYGQQISRLQVFTGSFPVCDKATNSNWKHWHSRN